MVTSLQQASRKRRLEVNNGVFESSFAFGLDLSEFDRGDTTRSSGAAASTAMKQTSAAAELLRIKALEAKRAACEEQKDVCIQNLAKKRGQELLRQSSTESSATLPVVRAPHDSQSSPTQVVTSVNLSATLVNMHGDDANGAHHKAKIQKKGKRSLNKAIMLRRKERALHKQVHVRGRGGKRNAVVSRRPKRAKY